MYGLETIKALNEQAVKGQKKNSRRRQCRKCGSLHQRVVYQFRDPNGVEKEILRCENCYHERTL